MSQPIGRKAQGLLKSTVGNRASGDYADLGVAKLYYFDTAITTGVTTIPATADVGDFASTIHATGGGSLFKCTPGAPTVWTAV